MLFLGDTHGRDFPTVLDLKTNLPLPIYCVGDCGIGFKASNPKMHSNSKFIAGNHDDRKLCETLPNYLGHYGYEENTGIFFLSGAWSIDRVYRTEGLDWWSYEELNIEESYGALDLYIKVKPRLVLTHDCPYSTISTLFGIEPIKTSTGQLLDAFFETHKPEKWIFGHHHKSRKVNILGTTFICLAEMELLNIE